MLDWCISNIHSRREPQHPFLVPTGKYQQRPEIEWTFLIEQWQIAGISRFQGVGDTTLN
jgi:hypothetical protein